MTIQDQLNRLLVEVPDIHLAAFGDLSSGLILNWAASRPCPREVLDLLGEQAANCLALLGNDALAADQGRSPVDASIIHFTEQASQIFTRIAPGSEDVLCTVCDPGTELEHLCRASAALAHSIADAS